MIVFVPKYETLQLRRMVLQSRNSFQTVAIIYIREIQIINDMLHVAQHFYWELKARVIGIVGDAG
jgi:hypothetical protein